VGLGWGGMAENGHIPVMASQVMELLSPQAGQVGLDCTAGRGGHARLLAERLGGGGRLVAMDMDAANVAFVREAMAGLACEVEVVHGNFATARQVLDDLGLPGADVLLADLGFASTQMDDAQRGLSFKADGPLDMRLDTSQPTTAADLVNRLGQRELADVIYEYGEERLSRRIARKIVDRRAQSPIRTTADLARIVRRAYGGRAGKPGRTGKADRGRIDPATRTFQALRIAVNGELDALQSLLDSLPALLNPGGRAAIISFHSLEDRLVKRRFQQLRAEASATVLTKKPLTADDDEAAANPRSRSAKLRAIRMA